MNKVEVTSLLEGQGDLTEEPVGLFLDGKGTMVRVLGLLVENDDVPSAIDAADGETVVLMVHGRSPF
jgi:hypothetical protein